MRLPLAVGFAAAIAATAQTATTAVACSSGPGSASASQLSRISGDWQASSPVSVPASKPPAFRDGVDLGLAPGGTRLDRMLLLLEPSAAQRAALDAELAAQQTPGSCEYHHWLTPQQFASAYSNSAADVNAVAGWLRTQGLTLAPLPASRGWIEFSGTAAQVTETFGAPVHAYSTPTGTRYALRSAISVPAALSSVIHGLVSLDGARSAAAITTPQTLTTSPAALAAEIDSSRAEAMTPQLAAQSIHFDSLPQGTGESIAIAARSNIESADIDAFRSTFGLAANRVAVVLNGADPGSTADRAAAELTASWAGAAAPAARIVVVPAGSTAATDGIDLSLAAIIDQSLAHTLLVGYSACEAALGESHQAFYAALYRQAAAQGIAAIAATGDSGAAACHAAGVDVPVSTGYAVNALAATPWNTAIGAAGFSASGVSEFAAWSPASAADPGYATGGGRSATYSAPVWQSGLQSGMAGSAAARVLPDITLPTALDSALSRGVAFCFSGSASISNSTSGCSLVRAGGSGAAAAIFAGVSAAIAQQNGAQGNLAPRLYALRSRTGVFSDVQAGTARLACAAGSQGCDASGTLGYDAATGFDFASGLGVPDASALLKAWPDVGATSSTVNLVATPSQPNTTYNPQASITLTATVSGTSGTPTGTIDFFDQKTGSNLESVSSALDSSGAASITVAGAMPQGGNSIIAKYSGDATYAAQDSAALTVNIQPSTTTTTVTPSTTTPKVNTAFTVTAALTVGTPPAGTVSPSGNMSLTIDGSTFATVAVSTSGGTTSASFTGVKIASPGSHNLQAIYVGDANYATSTSNSVAVNAAANTASVTLTVSPTQPNTTYNPTAAIIFMAAVATTSGGPTPTGTVNFLDEATGSNLNTSAVNLDSSGKASITVTGGLPQGGNSIVAEYGGDTTYAAVNSQALTVNIQPSTTTTTVTPSTTTPAAGVAFPVTVAVAVGSPPAGTAAPTGKITLNLDGQAYGSADAVTTSGKTSASFSVSVGSGGSHNLQAIYAGDSNYAASTSASVAVNATKGATVTTLAATPPTFTAGTAETFTATIAAASGSSTTNTFTGTVTFFDNASQLGTANVTSNVATLADVMLSSTSTHVITAVYSGDDSWGGSTSNAVTLKPILIPVTVTLAVTPPAASPGQVVSMTATVKPTLAPAAAIEQNPTGNVVFYNGTTILATVALTAAANNTATAQLLFSTLPAGQNSLSAVYVGDLFYAAGTSNTITIVVQDFSLTPDPSNPPSDLDINKGSSGQFAFQVAGQGGFNSPIAVACQVPATVYMTCVPNVSTITPNGTVTFTVNTFLTGSQTARRDNQPHLWSRAVSGTALAALLFFLLPCGHRVRIFSERGRRLLILLLLLGSLGSAGIGCSSSSQSVNRSEGTPLGETTLKITAAANIDNTVFSHSAYINVNVLAPGSTGTAQPVMGSK
jgi:subtilase family serine protease